MVNRVRPAWPAIRPVDWGNDREERGGGREGKGREIKERERKGEEKRWGEKEVSMRHKWEAGDSTKRSLKECTGSGEAKSRTNR